MRTLQSLWLCGEAEKCSDSSVPLTSFIFAKVDIFFMSNLCPQNLLFSWHLLCSMYNFLCLRHSAPYIIFFVRDTTHFLKKLRNVRKIPKNSFMVTMDIHSLYNNIDHEEGAEACFRALGKRNQKVVSSKTLKSMILFILKTMCLGFPI